jgi:hypothetical protein
VGEEYEGWLMQHKERIAQSMKKYHHFIFTDASVTREEDAIQADTAGVIHSSVVCRTLDT